MALHLPAHSLSDEPTSNIRGLHLNSSASLFATSTTDGWVVYRTNPLEVVTRRDLPDSSLRLVLPLERTNLLFLVGGPPSPLYPPNKVVVWDDKQGAAVAELEFREDVRGLAARRDRLIVILRRRVVIFVLGKGEAGIWREGSYETTDNPRGLVALATEPEASLLAFPGRQPGQVQLVRLPPYDPSFAPLPPPPSHDPTAAPFPSVSIILAHESSLSALSTTPSGSLLATSSSKGTLVRVWDPYTSALVKELRRGTDTAEIFGISFRRDGGAVAVSSDKGTVHVWDLKREKDDKRKSSSAGSESGSSTPRQKQLSLLKPYLPKYFSSTWSHSQFRLPPPAAPASRLPFTLSNPGPIPPNPLAPHASSASSAPTAPTTVEDDVCICAWVDVEVEVKDGEGDDDEDKPGSGAATPTAASFSRRYSSSSSATSSSSRLDRPAAPSAYSQPSPLRPYPLVTTAPFPSSSGKIPRSSASPGSSQPRPRRTRTEAQLVALTHSGGWFRIAFDPDAVSTSSSSASDTSSSSAAAKGKGKERADERGERKEEGVIGLGRDSTSDCRLVEYRKFGVRAEW
ncbi:hypothetical protein JCM6882_006716 [Rhodosporidiobolus microsporus]